MPSLTHIEPAAHYGPTGLSHPSRGASRLVARHSHNVPGMNGPPRVLVVDDEELFRLTVEDGMRRFSREFVVSTAPDGNEALRSIEAAQPALVVSDIRMPGMDGIELLLTCRKHYPHIPVVLVSAYFSERLERSAQAFGAARVMQKPLDLSDLVATIRELLDASRDTATNGAGSATDFRLAGFLQLLELERKTCGVEVMSRDGERGVLWLESGELCNAGSDDLRGREAALAVLGWESGQISLLPPDASVERRINESLSSLLCEAARLEAERGNAVVDPAASVGVKPAPTPARRVAPRELAMPNVQDALAKCKDVDGFIGIGAFSPQGELIGQVANAGVELAELGALANDVLLKAQKSTDIMGVGRGNQVHVEAPKAHILVRCLNENADFADSEPGRAHVHCVLVLEKNGNLALGKMRLDSAIHELAPLCR